MGLDSVMGYLKVENNFFNIDIEAKENNYKLDLVTAILKRDFEILYKQIQLSDLIGEISLYNNHMDDMLGVEYAMSLSFGKKYSEINENIRSLLEETCYIGFFSRVNIKKLIEDSELVSLAKKLGLLIYNTSSRSKGLIETQSITIFFQEFKKIFPDMKVEYFERNFQAYLNRPSGVDGGE